MAYYGGMGDYMGLIGFYNNKYNPDAKALDNQLRYYAQALPIIGDLARFYDNNKRTQDYLKNRGISWSDVRYPTALPSGSLSSSVGMIDKNLDAIGSLYQDKPEPQPKPIKYNHHGTAYTSRNFYNDY